MILNYCLMIYRIGSVIYGKSEAEDGWLPLVGLFNPEQCEQQTL